MGVGDGGALGALPVGGMHAGERAVADRLQREGERMWPRMHVGDWAGRNVDEMSPLTYPAFDPGVG